MRLRLWAWPVPVRRSQKLVAMQRKWQELCTIGTMYVAETAECDQG